MTKQGKRKPFTKAERELIFRKCNGKCAYCGCNLQLKDMQIDHIDSCARKEKHNEQIDNNFENLMPACRACNFYKSTFPLEVFRKNLLDTLMPNLRATFQFRLAEKYGLVTANETEKIVFEFEKIND